MLLPIDLGKEKKLAWVEKAIVAEKEKKKKKELKKQNAQREPFSVWQVLEGEIVKIAGKII